MALHGTINGTTSNSYIATRIVWSATQDIANNSSTITATLYYKRTNSGYTTNGWWKGSITTNGTTYSPAAKLITITENEWTAAATQTITVKHNNDGTKSVSITASGSIPDTTLDNTNISGTITLNKIARKATITSAPNFTDETNPVIKYSNTAGAAVASLQACIADANGSTIYVPYRGISKTGSSYGFSLTDDERTTLRKAAANSKTLTVKFYIKTVIGNETYYDNVSKTMTIINANPTLSPVVADTGKYSTALTGDTNKIIKGYNAVSVNSVGKALKEATIRRQTITDGTTTINSGAGGFSNTESATFTFTITDSRGYSTTQTVNKTLINYVKLTCNFSGSAPTTGGDMSFKISGNYFNGSFGAKANTLTVQYRYKVNGGSYGNWITAAATINGNTYTATVNLTGLNYLNTYTFEARAADAIYNGTGEAMITTAAKTLKTLPVFDWGANDFSFNVPVEFKAGAVNHNVLLWQGAIFMTANQTAPLATPISSQTSGIVLVFSNYDTTNSKANDYDWHCYFVPKYLVDIKGGTGHCFNMMSQSFGDVASKYIYISDTVLTGHDNNTTNGTRNGITYNNAKYVLRYVFGV